MKTPDQELYDRIFQCSLDLGYKTYAFNPAADAAYPFIKVGSVQMIPIATKSYLMGTAIAHFDVWGDKVSRKAVSDMADALINKISIMPFEGFIWKMDLNGISVELMTDNSTNNDLWRARVTLPFKFN